MNDNPKYVSERSKNPKIFKNFQKEQLSEEKWTKKILSEAVESHLFYNFDQELTFLVSIPMDPESFL